VNGHRRREYEEWQRTAWLFCQIAALVGGEKMTIDKFIGKPPEPIEADPWAS
jgi:hypothetical protein